MPHFGFAPRGLGGRPRLHPAARGAAPAGDAAPAPPARRWRREAGTSGESPLAKYTRRTTDKKSTLLVFTEHTGRPRSRPLAARRPPTPQPPTGGNFEKTEGQGPHPSGPPKPHTADPRGRNPGGRTPPLSPRASGVLDSAWALPGPPGALQPCAPASTSPTKLSKYREFCAYSTGAHRAPLHKLK